MLHKFVIDNLIMRKQNHKVGVILNGSKTFTIFLMCWIQYSVVTGQNIQSDIVQKPCEKQITTKRELKAEPGVFANFIPVTNETKFIISHHSSPNESEENETLQQMKAEKSMAKQNVKPTHLEVGINRRAANISVGNSFSGNAGYGCPSDNTVAISSTGNIISGENCNYYYYSENGKLLGYTSMSNLFSGVSLVSNMCDPKVVFDSYANRFILFAQVCDGVPSNSRLLLAFSLTSNPLDGFYTYWFNGNPLNDNSWFDYPRIAVYTNEILVTGNLYYGSGGNNQSVIYQINKNDCYKGNFPAWQYWYNITNSPFTILPLSYGQDGTVGPPYNLVNTHGSGSGNSLDFYQLTGEISASSETIKHWTVNVTPYSAPGNASQLNGSNYIDAGDCRMMDGFYLDGYAHFVHTYDESGWSGIRYNRLKISDLTNTTYNIQNAGRLDYAYPAICSFGTSSTDKSVLVSFCSSGPTVYPEMRAKLIDDAMQSNTSIVVKSGLAAVSSCYDQKRGAARWGDYSGAWRKPYSSRPVAWVSGSYGNYLGSWGTWIAEIGIEGTFTNIEKQVSAPSLNISPNPSFGSFIVNISVPETGTYTMKIFTSDGKEADFFELGKIAQGDNAIKYLKKLASGIYFVSVMNQQGKEISNEKIVVVE